MESSKPISIITLVIISLFTIEFILEVILELSPMYFLFSYLTSNHLEWAFMLFMIIVLLLLKYEKLSYERTKKKKSELFNTTIHTVQDIIQESIAKVEILKFDLEDNNTSREIIAQTEDIIKEMKSVIRILSGIDPFKTPTRKLREGINVFNIYKK